MRYLKLFEGFSDRSKGLVTSITPSEYDAIIKETPSIEITDREIGLILDLFEKKYRDLTWTYDAFKDVFNPSRGEYQPHPHLKIDCRASSWPGDQFYISKYHDEWWVIEKWVITNPYPDVWLLDSFDGIKKFVEGIK